MKSKLSRNKKTIMFYGTPKEKAELAALGYTDRAKLDKPPVITRAEIEMMQDGMSDNQLDEYNHWVLCYEILATVAPFIGLLYAEYKVMANQLLLSLEKWNAFYEAQNLYLALQKVARQRNAPEVEGLAERISKSASARIKFDKLTWRSILKLRDTTTQRLESIKGAIIATQEWVKEKDCKDLVPPIINETIRDTKTDLALQVSRRYSRTELERKRRRGIIVTQEDEEMAIFPTYAEVRESQFFYNAVMARFRDLEQQAEQLKKKND